MKTLKTFEAIYQTVEKSVADDAPIYVRFSMGPKVDEKYGWCSRNHVTGHSEAGLSVNPLIPECPLWEDMDLQKRREWVAQQVCEYQHIGEGRCWLMHADECGTGSDNEPIVENVRPFAYVSLPALDEANEIDAAARRRFLASKGY